MRFQVARKSGTNTASLRTQGAPGSKAKRKRAKLAVAPELAWFVVPQSDAATIWLRSHLKEKPGEDIRVTKRDKAGGEYRAYRLMDSRMTELCRAHQAHAEIRFEIFREEHPGGAIILKSYQQACGCNQ